MVNIKLPTTRLSAIPKQARLSSSSTTSKRTEVYWACYALLKSQHQYISSRALKNKVWRYASAQEVPRWKKNANAEDGVPSIVTSYVDVHNAVYDTRWKKWNDNLIIFKKMYRKNVQGWKYPKSISFYFENVNTGFGSGKIPRWEKLQTLQGKGRKPTKPENPRSKTWEGKYQK